MSDSITLYRCENGHVHDSLRESRHDENEWVCVACRSVWVEEVEYVPKGEPGEAARKIRVVCGEMQAAAEEEQDPATASTLRHWMSELEAARPQRGEPVRVTDELREAIWAAQAPLRESLAASSLTLFHESLVRQALAALEAAAPFLDTGEAT